MPLRLPPESPATSRRHIEHFFDVVAKLLAKRWLREQQSQPADATKRRKSEGDSQTLKA